MKTKTIISEKKILEKIVSKNEIKSVEVIDYKKIFRNKIITFIPTGSVNKVFKSMVSKGAGKIGEYSECSFMMNGVGTFRPDKSSKPLIGEKGKLNFEEEVRLEMECGDEELNEVVIAMLKSHPYEEPAYEIHRFSKLKNESDGVLVTLVKPVAFAKILTSTNSIIDETLFDEKFKVKKFILRKGGVAEDFFSDQDFDLIISYNSNKFKINKK